MLGKSEFLAEAGSEFPRSDVGGEASTGGQGGVGGEEERVPAVHKYVT